MSSWFNWFSNAVVSGVAYSHHPRVTGGRVLSMPQSDETTNVSKRPSGGPTTGHCSATPHCHKPSPSSALYQGDFHTHCARDTTSSFCMTTIDDHITIDPVASPITGDATAEAAVNSRGVVNDKKASVPSVAYVPSTPARISGSGAPNSCSGAGETSDLNGSVMVCDTNGSSHSRCSSSSNSGSSGSNSCSDGRACVPPPSRLRADLSQSSVVCSANSSDDRSLPRITGGSPSKRQLPARPEKMNEVNSDRLESVFVVHRHSVRAPTYFPAGDPYLNSRNYARGAGYLTTKGIAACGPIANVWSSWYPEHIHGLDHTAVFVRSSESPRCHETAQALMSSLFNTSETICPVPVYGPPPGFDHYVSLEGYNKDINAELKNHYQDPVSQPNTLDASTFGDILEAVKDVMTVPAPVEYEAFTFLDGMVSNLYEGHPLPDFWTRNKCILTEVYEKCYALVIEQYRPYYGGHLLRGMAYRMKQVFNKELSSGARWCAYSFHDFSLTAIYHALEAEVDLPKPHFLAAIFFELRTANDGSQWIELYHSDGLCLDGSYSPREPLRMRWNGGSHRVAFTKMFDKMYNNVYIDDLFGTKGKKRNHEDNRIF